MCGDGGVSESSVTKHSIAFSSKMYRCPMFNRYVNVYCGGNVGESKSPGGTNKDTNNIVRFLSILM